MYCDYRSVITHKTRSIFLYLIFLKYQLTSWCDWRSLENGRVVCVFFLLSLCCIIGFFLRKFSRALKLFFSKNSMNDRSGPPLSIQLLYLFFELEKRPIRNSPTDESPSKIDEILSTQQFDLRWDLSRIPYDGSRNQHDGTTATVRSCARMPQPHDYWSVVEFLRRYWFRIASRRSTCIRVSDLLESPMITDPNRSLHCVAYQKKTVESSS